MGLSPIFAVALYYSSIPCPNHETWIYMEQERPRAEVRQSLWTEKAAKPQSRLPENSNSYIFWFKGKFDQQLSAVVKARQIMTFCYPN